MTPPDNQRRTGSEEHLSGGSEQKGAMTGAGLPPYIPVLFALFVASGCAALIYEIVWFQVLNLIVGSSAVSLAVVLGTYMGGMLLGSMIVPLVISAKRHPLSLYALFEVGIGVFGILVVLGMPVISALYGQHAGVGSADLLIRAAICAICLLPPTILMGATLPVAARWVTMAPKGVSWLGFLYAGNTAGAVIGCLTAGFFLLRVFDIVVATGIAVAINAAIGGVAFWLSRRTEYYPVASTAPAGASTGGRGNVWVVYLVTALSGFCALGGEVVWTRLLSLIIGGTVYTFSIILAVFLIGIVIGSAVASLAKNVRVHPLVLLGWCQVLLVAAIAWAAYMITRALPFWPIDPRLISSPWFGFQLDILRSLWAILPAAALWGASFPLAMAAVASDHRDPGKVVGGLYAANTLGAIIGAVGTSLVLVPLIGSQGAQRVLIYCSGVAGLLALSASTPWKEAGATAKARILRPVAITGAAILVIAAMVVLADTVISPHWGLTGYGRYLVTWIERLAPGVYREAEVPYMTNSPDIYCLYEDEGMNESVAVSLTTAGVKNFHAAGKVQASSHPTDMRLQRMLGHLAALPLENPKSALIVACGSGMTAGTFVTYPTIDRIVICELERLVTSNVAPFFAKENYNVVEDPRTQVVCDDGRHFVSTTKEKFDIITSDPIDPWVKGCAALYTEEFFTTCRNHLKPGGVLTLWVPFYESNTETVKSLMATFFKVFPDGVIFSNDSGGQGYDSVLFGQVGESGIDIDKMQERLGRPDYTRVVQSLSEIGFSSVFDLMSTYAGDGPHMAQWLSDSPINRDRNLRLQYLAGMGVNMFQRAEILDGILSNYAVPEGFFRGSAENIDLLRFRLNEKHPVAPSPEQQNTGYPGAT